MTSVTEAQMMRDIREATAKVLRVYLLPRSEVLVARVINNLYRKYGLSSLCGLTSLLIRASVPADFAAKLQAEENPIVMPVLADDDGEGCGECDDCKNYAVMNGVSQYIAAVVVNDTDNLIAIFKANVRDPHSEWSQRFLSLTISTACNTYFDVEEDE